MDLNELFELDPEYCHLSLAILTSHPKPVQKAIDYHRHELNKNPIAYFSNKGKLEKLVREKAAAYLGGVETNVILTESTTMGLGLIYGGLELKEGDEILTTEHEHFSTVESLRYKNANLKVISLYENPFEVTVEEILQRLKAAISSKTKVVAITWVHSCSGVKLPLAAIGTLIKTINPEILLVVDAVHALGVEEIDINALKCDFLIAGCHKWLFGPRGTGLVYASDFGLSHLKPIIPSFNEKVFFSWLKKKDLGSSVPRAFLCTPGGFQAYEHRFALAEAFDLHLQIGKRAVFEKISKLNTYFKEMLQPLVTLKTPLDPALSAGIICFEMKNKNPAEIAHFLWSHKIIAGQTPYHKTYCRVTPGLLNREEEAEKLISALAQLR